MVNAPAQEAPSVTVNLPEQKAEVPVVNVTLPEAVPPVVNVTVPEQKAGMVQEIRIVGQPAVQHTVIRDKSGLMVGTVEEPIE